MEQIKETLVDGWLHTGDLAKIDRNDYIYILGRKKNVIVLKNGKNVYPEEIEVLISNLPFVKEVFVFGQSRESRAGSTGSRSISGNENNDLVVTAKIVYDTEYFKLSYAAEAFEDVEK